LGHGLRELYGSVSSDLIERYDTKIVNVAAKAMEQLWARQTFRRLCPDTCFYTALHVDPIRFGRKRTAILIDESHRYGFRNRLGENHVSTELRIHSSTYSVEKFPFEKAATKNGKIPLVEEYCTSLCRSC